MLGYLSPVTDEEIAKAKKSDSPYLRSDQVGRSGLERTYDKELRGKAGITRYEVDNLGRVIGQGETDPAKPGSNIVTSIDSRVQAVAERELNNAMIEARKTFDENNTRRNYEADSGSVVVMETKTGRVVAMASNPTYDPNAWVGGISGEGLRGPDRQGVELPAAEPGDPGARRRRLHLQGGHLDRRGQRRVRVQQPLPLPQLVLGRQPDLHELRVAGPRRHHDRPGPGGLLRHGLLR